MYSGNICKHKSVLLLCEGVRRSEKIEKREEVLEKSKPYFVHFRIVFFFIIFLFDSNRFLNVFIKIDLRNKLDVNWRIHLKQNSELLLWLNCFEKLWCVLIVKSLNRLITLVYPTDIYSMFKMLQIYIFFYSYIFKEESKNLKTKTEGNLTLSLIFFFK